MRRSFVVACCAVVLILGVRKASALPTVDELLKEAVEAQKDVGSFSADTNVSMSMGPMRMAGTGKMAGKKDTKDGETLRRFFQTLKTKTTAPNGQEIEMQQKVVNDGKFLWMETRHPMMPAPMVTKQRAEDSLPGGAGRPGADPSAQMEQFKEMYDLKVTGEDRMDGVEVYILEGKLREDYVKKHRTSDMLKAMMYKMKLHVGQKDFFPRKFVCQTEQGQETSSMELKNVKLNVKVDDSLFKYTPPPGAQVTDQTGR
ncbi:MAG: hypothetical protein AMS16_04835 [Planctomycetes bacterium DG_58]|nr:MAG: hypothetical protein AMS16_04835 [Planctomycetes bacterium DG_58]